MRLIYAVLILLLAFLTSAQCQQTAEDWNKKGVDLYIRGEYDEAIKAFDEAIRLDPKYAQAWSNKGAALSNQGNHDDAGIKALDEAIRLDPGNYNFKSKKGRILIKHNLSSTSEFKGEPSYAMEIQASSNKINRGDNLSISIYVQGAGDVDYNKLRINIPSYIVQDETLEFSRMNIFDNKRDILESGEVANIILPKYYFICNSSINEILFNTTINLSNLGGFTAYGKAPFIINFTTSKKAPSGDHQIHSILFYKFNDKWYVDKQVLQIHIRDWYEQDWMQWLAALALISGILLAVGESFKFYNSYKIEKKKE